ncbi:MAG: ribbon-helix-helix domain-containing protein [Actinobacteria bacterium]|nr:ribbon-helix-helix domain-containing protein [Actinomycetota bacterium]
MTGLVHTLSYSKSVREVTVAERASKVLSVSVPPDLARDFERLAEQQGRNKSELFREMLRVYQAYQETGRFEILQRYGAARARGLAIEDEDDVERLIQQARHG